MALALKNQPEALVRVKSLIPSLDHAIEDFRDGEVIAISGPTKNGKTLLAQTLTANFDRQQQPSLWFSYEVTPRQFLEQFGADLPLFFMPKKLKAHALPWIEERILEGFAKYHTRIVFIDHLHYLIDLARTRNPSIEIGTVVRFLKSLAVREEMIVFLLCHTTKGASEEALSYESIRDSSFVSQESDSVIMIRRTPKEGKNAARASVEFHRRTGVLEKMIKLQKVGPGLFEVADRESPEPYWDR
jgi:replicative DNA helicase